MKPAQAPPVLHPDARFSPLAIWWRDVARVQGSVPKREIILRAPVVHTAQTWGKYRRCTVSRTVAQRAKTRCCIKRAVSLVGLKFWLCAWISDMVVVWWGKFKLEEFMLRGSLFWGRQNYFLFFFLCQTREPNQIVANAVQIQANLQQWACSPHWETRLCSISLVCTLCFSTFRFIEVCGWRYYPQVEQRPAHLDFHVCSWWQVHLQVQTKHWSSHAVQKHATAKLQS